MEWGSSNHAIVAATRKGLPREGSEIEEDGVRWKDGRSKGERAGI
jgi:hypothetical protein